MLHIMPSLDLMAITPLLIGAKEEKEAGEVTLTEITNSIMVSLTVETMGALPGRTPGTTTAIGSSRNKKGKTRCQLCSNIGHSAQQYSQLIHHGNQALANLCFSDASASNPVTWFPDTGANQHVTPDMASTTHEEPYLGNDQLYIGDGKGLNISNTAHKILHTPKRTFYSI